jgi:hypothetical protein
VSVGVGAVWTVLTGDRTAWATVNAGLFEQGPSRPGAESRARCALFLGDAQVLAGTQGYFHHLKLGASRVELFCGTA